MFRGISILALVVLPATAARAAVVTVSKNGPLTTIQAGIDAASDGDTVRILAGTYSETIVVPLQKPGLVLHGKGKVVVDARGLGGAPLGPAIDVASNGAALRGLTIRHAAATGLDAGDGVRVIGDEVLIEKCSFEGNENAAIRVFGSNAHVRKCAFRSNGVGVLVESASDARVESSSFRHCGSSVRLIDATSAVLDKLTITEGGNSSAIATQGTCDATSVTRCTIRESGDSAVSLSGAGCRIADVQVVLTAGGISISGDNAVVERCKVATAVDGSDGIAIFGSTNFRVSDNRVRGASNTGIVVNQCTGGLVEGNRVQRLAGASTIGFDVQQSTDVLLDSNRVDFASLDGFFVEGSGHVLRDCIARDCGRDGFDLRPDAAGARLEQCVALRCDGEGIENSATGVELVDCVAKDNRIDLANDGTLAIADVKFKTGGTNVAPEVD